MNQQSSSNPDIAFGLIACLFLGGSFSQTLEYGSDYKEGVKVHRDGRVNVGVT